MARDYNIGYGKPPPQHRFKPGQSGNKKGRPKKQARSLLHYLDDELRSKMKVQENGLSISLMKSQILAKTVINGAIKGDNRAIHTLLRYLPLLEKYSEEHVRPPKIIIELVKPDGTTEVIA